jgi:hypothetical protein
MADFCYSWFGQADKECCSFIRFAIKPYFPIMIFNNLLADRKSEAERFFAGRA